MAPDRKPDPDGKSIKLSQIIIYAALIGTTGTMCTVAKTCTHDAAPILGLQTTTAAAASGRVNTEEHNKIIEAIVAVDERRESDRQDMVKAQQQMHEITLETLEAISPRRAKKIRGRQKKP